MLPLKRKVKFLKLAGVLFFLGFALLYSHVEVGMSGNESGRFATIQAIAEQGVFHIEKCNFRTVDRTIRNNHVYYDKLPFLPLCLAGVYAPFHHFGKINFVDNYHLSIYLINFLLGAVVNILLFLWLFDLLRSFKHGTPELKCLLALGCVGGSWILSYSTMLNNHTPAALAVLGICVALRRYSQLPHWKSAVLGGLAAGIAGLLELPCGFFFGAALLGGIFFTAPAGKRAAHTLCAAFPGILCICFALALNKYAYDSWLPLYFGSHGAKGTFSVGSQSDPLSYWYHALIGDRGLFIYTPFLLAGLWGVVKFRRDFTPAEKSLTAGTAAFMLFYLTCTNEFGGQSYGLRYFIPVIPLIWLAGARAVLQVRRNRLMLGLAVFLIVWGVVTALAGAYFPFCIGNEGERSPKGHFTRHFSSFGGNLLCWSYENFPQSSLTRELLNRYGLPESVTYMYWSFFHQKKLTELQRMQQDFPGLFPGKKFR